MPKIGEGEVRERGERESDREKWNGYEIANNTGGVKILAGVMEENGARVPREMA